MRDAAAKRCGWAVRWPGISVAGQELRNLHLLRYAIPNALPGEPCDSRSFKVERQSGGQPFNAAGARDPPEASQQPGPARSDRALAVDVVKRNIAVDD